MTFTKNQKNKLILVAEDNKINQLVITAHLKKLGYTCYVVDDGNQALEFIMRDDELPLLIFMDCQMPHMDGLEATRRIRTFLAGRPMPIIAITAHAFFAERERCLAAGMDEYLTKPIFQQDLRDVLKLYVG